MSLLVVDNITAAYGKAVVLHNLSLNVEEGEISALLGSNGSGKTTLIKTILGLVKPMEGSIQFGGKHIQGMDITIVTTAGTDEEALELLRLMDMPFRR